MVDTLKRDTEETILQIKIRDTGIGIARDKQEKIFERFFQTELPHTMLNQGSGIGLAISQEFVKMQNGTLTVESELNKGSCFTIMLPFKEIPLLENFTPAIVTDEEEYIESLPAPATAAPTAVAAPGTPGAKKHAILIVEDNEDFLFYMKDNLRAAYNVYEASHGKEGWRKALSLHPDLIVSDISMPVMNGIDLCKKLKSDERTKHIPVILLTALAAEGNELESLQTGATDYISKPFNFEVLQSKIRNILDYQETIKKTYQRQVEASPAPVEASSADDQFLHSVLRLIETNMSNTDFSVEELSQQMHISRSSFYKRLVMVTGKTPVEFIRHMRLKKAAELLEKSQMTVSEIAYEVGFNNPKYFTQQFRLEFDIAPSLYRTGKKQKMDS
jgi:DNA-binding response OmpR family regulator